MKCHALFVGVNQYDDPELPGLSFAVSDASQMAGFFRQCVGFDRAEVLANPPNREAILSRVAELTAGLGAGDLFVFSFSGRGIDVRHDRVMLCSGDSPLEAKKDWAGLPLGLLKYRIQGPFRSLFLLDDRREGVRDETSAESPNGNGRDMSFSHSTGVDAGGERTVVFACKGNGAVWEVPARKCGLFPSALLESLSALHEEGEVLEFSDALLEDVGNRMNGLAKADNLPCEARPEKDGRPIAIAAGRRGRTNASRMRRDSGAPASNPDERKAGDRLRICLFGVEFAFRWCPPGSFVFGSPRSERGRFWDERPLPLTFLRGFWMGETPVTQDQWQAVMHGDNPSHHKGADLPVENFLFNDLGKTGFLYWAHDAAASQKVPFRFCLPSECEWEYACRAGTGGPFGGTGKLEEMGWFRGNANGKTHPVGRKEPNGWGLLDMHGNVMECCMGGMPECHQGYLDCSMLGGGSPQDDPRMQRHFPALKGGSFKLDARRCRSAFRRARPDGNFRSNDVGFRLMAWEDFGKKGKS